MISIMILLASLVIATSPPALDDALGQLTRQKEWSTKDKKIFIQSWDKNALIDAIASRLRDDPAFAIGTEARVRARSILGVMYVQPQDGRRHYDDPRIIDIFISDLESGAQPRLGLIRALGMSAPQFHARVYRALEPLLLVETDGEVVMGLVSALAGLTVPLSAEVMERLADLAFDPEASESLHYPPPEPVHPHHKLSSQKVILSPPQSVRLAALGAGLRLGRYDDIDRYPQLDEAGQLLAAGALMGMFGRTQGRFDGVEEHQIKAVRAIGELYSDPVFSEFLFADGQMTGENFAWLFAYPLGDNDNSEAYRREAARVMLEIIAATKDQTALDYAEQITRNAGFNPQDLTRR